MDNQPPTPEQKIKKAKFILWLGIIIIIVIGLAVAVYFVFVKTTGQGNVNVVKNFNTLNNINTNANVNNVVKTAGQWYYYPDFYNIYDILEDGDTIWVAALGGLAKYDKTTSTLKAFTTVQGLADNAVWSLDLEKEKNYLWVGTGGGVSRLNIKTNEIKNYYNEQELKDESKTFRIDLQDQFTGLASNSNIQLRRDSYTNTLWAATFRGLSWYDEKADSWSSYGVGDSVLFAGVGDVAFDQKYIWIYITKNAYTPGGVLRMDKSTQQWKAYNENNGLPLNRDEIFITAGDDYVWATGRPADWSSAKDRENIIYQYKSLDDSWIRITKLEQYIKLNDKITSFTYKNGKLAIKYHTYTSGDSTMAYYDPKTEEVTTKKPEASFTETYFDKVGPASSRNIVLTTLDDYLVLNSLYYFNTQKQEFVNSPWDTIRNYKNGEITGTNFKPLACNHWNNHDGDIYLLNESSGMDYSFLGFFVYRSATKKIEILMNQNDWESKVASDPFRCSGDTLWFFTDNGVEAYSLKDNKSTIYDNNYKSDYTILMSDVTRVYFWTNDGELGIFSLIDKDFEYLQLPSITITDKTYTQEDLKGLLLETTDNKVLWFIANRPDSPLKNYIFKFDRTKNAWDIFDMSKIFIQDELPMQLKVFKNDVWLATEKNVYKLKDGKFQALSSSDGMMNYEYVSMFTVTNGIWFSSVGMWGFQE